MCASTDAVAHPIRHSWRGILAAALVAIAVTASADPVPTIMSFTVNGQGRGDRGSVILCDLYQISEVYIAVIVEIALGPERRSIGNAIVLGDFNEIGKAD